MASPYRPNAQALAWAAGFFDGEGSTTLQNANSTRPRDYLTPQVSISQHGSPECLERFQAAVGGLGTLRGPDVYPGRYTGPRWTWAARRHDNAQAVIAMLWPWLSGPKRAQALQVFDRYNEDRLLHPRRQWRRANPRSN